MEIFDVLNLILLVAILIVVVYFAYYFHKRIRGGGDTNISEVIKEQLDISNNMGNQSMQNLHAMMTTAIGALGTSLNQNIDTKNSYQNAKIEKLEKQFSDVAEQTQAAQKELQKELFAFLEAIRKENTEQEKNLRTELEKRMVELNNVTSNRLNEVKEVVDEKLTTTINERFNKSFEMVSERLDAITKGFGEIQSLTTGVTDLKKVLFNVKTRGVWGENSLDNLLEQILAPEQYEKFVNISQKNMVDFAIKLPGKGKDTVYLPIDAKFPIEDYGRLMTASEMGDGVAVEEASKKLVATVKLQAKSISDKYISPPKTTDFAIMYLPIEGLYAETLKMDGLVESLQNEYRVIIAGPTTIAALLNSLQMGFKTLAIQKSSSEIWKLFASFRKEFDTFSGILLKTRKKLDEVTNTIDQANKRNGIIQKKLDKAGRLAPSEEFAELEANEEEIDD